MQLFSEIAETTQFLVQPGSIEVRNNTVHLFQELIHGSTLVCETGRTRSKLGYKQIEKHGRAGAVNVLVHESSEEYRTAVQAAEVYYNKSPAFITDKVIGAAYKLRNGKIGYI